MNRQFVHDESNAPTHSFLLEALEGLKDKQTTELTSEGTGATYILRDSHHYPIAVFKPADEEAFAPCNPRGYRGIMGQAGFREGVCSGEQAAREVAAYALDHSGFSRVPATVLVRIGDNDFSYIYSNKEAEPKLGAC